ncbi:hypothetical protein CALVIDRAFT_528954 [Calocera viscosa TUFC12733]|uniref:Uncharacterized protein n=1 Tax=Calocera viscosa (strain TUFC12733) TaxID=1330018 RepID=A0A167K2B6_CALVF|nr:hypothetical protein CALVIDRAFT_528954 [Calocera viscosa TUFC12733]
MNTLNHLQDAIDENLPKTLNGLTELWEEQYGDLRDHTMPIATNAMTDWVGFAEASNYQGGQSNLGALPAEDLGTYTATTTNAFDSAAYLKLPGLHGILYGRLCVSGALIRYDLCCYKGEVDDTLLSAPGCPPEVSAYLHGHEPPSWLEKSSEEIKKEQIKQWWKGPHPARQNALRDDIDRIQLPKLRPLLLPKVAEWQPRFTIKALKWYLLKVGGFITETLCKSLVYSVTLSSIMVDVILDIIETTNVLLEMYQPAPGESAPKIPFPVQLFPFIEDEGRYLKHAGGFSGVSLLNASLVAALKSRCTERLQTYMDNLLHPILPSDTNEVLQEACKYLSLLFSAAEPMTFDKFPLDVLENAAKLLNAAYEASTEDPQIAKRLPATVYVPKIVRDLAQRMHPSWYEDREYDLDMRMRQLTMSSADQALDKPARRTPSQSQIGAGGRRAHSGQSSSSKESANPRPSKRTRNSNLARDEAPIDEQPWGVAPQDDDYTAPMDLDEQIENPTQAAGSDAGSDASTDWEIYYSLGSFDEPNFRLALPNITKQYKDSNGELKKPKNCPIGAQGKEWQCPARGMSYLRRCGFLVVKYNDNWLLQLMHGIHRCQKCQGMNTNAIDNVDASSDDQSSEEDPSWDEVCWRFMGKYKAGNPKGANKGTNCVPPRVWDSNFLQGSADDDAPPDPASPEVWKFLRDTLGLKGQPRWHDKRSANQSYKGQTRGKESKTPQQRKAEKRAKTRQENERALRLASTLKLSHLAGIAFLYTQHHHQANIIASRSSMLSVPNAILPTVNSYFKWFYYAQSILKHWDLNDPSVRDTYEKRQAVWTLEMKSPSWNWTQVDLRDWMQVIPKLHMLHQRLHADLARLGGPDELLWHFDAYFSAFGIASNIQDHLECQVATAQQLEKEMAKRFFGRTEAQMAPEVLAQEDVTVRTLLENDLYREAHGDPSAPHLNHIMQRSSSKKPPITYRDEDGTISQFKLLHRITKYDEAKDTITSKFLIRDKCMGLIEISRAKLLRMYGHRICEAAGRRDAAPGLPAWLLNLPPGRYGIAYDFTWHLLIDHPPDGYFLNGTGAWYGNVIKKLRAAGLMQAEKSMYEAVGDPASFYMLKLQMYSVPRDEMILTDDFRLGGVESPALLRPTPAELDENNLGQPMAVAPPPPRHSAPDIVMVAAEWHF